jgi:hypothetical protein
MSILGSALAAYISGLKGLYSVELPIALRHELVDLVAACNESDPSRALLVTEHAETTAGIGVKTTSWAELLGWRTSDDRIFVWERGAREPDTSFQSVVKPFISSRFPGNPSGECNLDLLAKLSIEELWRRRNWDPLGDDFDAFLVTARWVAKVLRSAFERVGSTPSVHWSDEFLVHWAEMLNHLDLGLGKLAVEGVRPQPRHAWEIIRVSGFPVPFKIVSKGGNPFLEAPEELGRKEWSRFVQNWQEVFEDYVLDTENISVLLTALDWRVKSADKTSSWRGLDWTIPATLSSLEMIAAPKIGQMVFTSSPSPSLLTVTPPTYPVVPKPAWWGITDADIQDAIKQLQETVQFEPAASCTAVSQAIDGRPGLYWLHTREGAVTHKHTKKQWRAQVLVSDLELVFKHTWTKVIVSHSKPKDSGDGFVWIEPDDIDLNIPGVKRSKLSLATPSSGLQLSILFDLLIEYRAKRGDETALAQGSWGPIRNLRLQARVHDCVGDKWKSAKRQVDASLNLIVPSPFSFTVLVGGVKGRVVPAPGSGDDYAAALTPGESWEAESTPDLVLKEEGLYAISAYDGRIDPASPAFFSEATPGVNDARLLAGRDTGSGPYMWQTRLDDGDVITSHEQRDVQDVAVVKVSERSGSKSSGLLSAVRGLQAGQRQPSTEAKSSLLGRYQDKVAQALRDRPGNLPHSLYQYVVSTGETRKIWPSHAGTPSPEFLFERKTGLTLPGIGNGPGPGLTKCPEWTRFMEAVKEVCLLIGLQPGTETIWLSGFNPADIPARVVRAYLKAHLALVKAAKEESQADAFWAKYPFSVMIVEGSRTPAFGQLLAILLSPLHPVRLAWAFSLAFIAGSKSIGRGLLGLAEGWNMPFTGSTVSAGGQQIPMVAIPVDPGDEQDFAAWSALAVLDRAGLAELPASAAGLPLPWGGQTGINRKVVERAIKDYLAVHPHLNSLEVDIRSISNRPRSKELDDVILRLVGGIDSLAEIENLGGSTRVWDAASRLGPAPLRDELFVLREEDNRRRPFEWRTYHSPDPPANADIAFIENSSVHLVPTQGTVNGILGLLPMRRFCPPTLDGLVFDQNYTGEPGDDLLGLSLLLAEIEHSEGGPLTALRASPRADAIGVGMGARWEILGTFNLDPALLATVVALQAQSSGKRLLWEWRPSWLSAGSRSTDEISRRPYYVVGRIPASLLKALEYRQGFTAEQASEMLVELGQRGIGLTSLHAAGGTQESAAAGFFYSLKLLLPAQDHPLPATWALPASARGHWGFIPIDPIESVLEEMAGEQLGRRADLLGVQIKQAESGKVLVCLVPVEVKHHGRPSKPEPLPGNANEELARARQQLAETASLVKNITKAILPQPENIAEMPGSYARLLGLATLIELAMSFATAPVDTAWRGNVLKRILGGQVAIGVGKPVLLWFAPGSITMSGQACLVDPYGESQVGDWLIKEVFIDPTVAPGLWWSGGPAGPDEKQIRKSVDAAMVDALKSCAEPEDLSSLNIREGLRDMLGLRALVSTPQSGEQASTDEEHAEAFDKQETHKDVPTGAVDVEARDREANQTTSSDVGISHDVGTDIPAATQASMPVPPSFVGWSSPTTRWTVVGQLAGTDEKIALDFDRPKAAGIFGYMGSGKSYLLGAIIEAALEPIPNINLLPDPLAVVIFNYRRNALDRFELASLASPNQKASDAERLATQFDAHPQGMRDIQILCLPGELTQGRLMEYGGLAAAELFFNPATLTVEDWELLMGEPGSGAVFARTIRHALRDLRSSGEITLEGLEALVSEILKGQSLTAAQLRFEFVRRYISKENGIDFDQVLRPGKALIFDLRQPLFSKDDALRFFLVCANYVSRAQGKFNKIVVFDEAHEYLSNEFGEKLESRIRLMRHEGTSYIFATQDVASIPLTIRRFITTKFVFDLGTRENIGDLLRFAPEFDGYKLQGMPPGDCLLQANESKDNVFSRPRAIHVRPRVTQHGGATRIYSSTSNDGET